MLLTELPASPLPCRERDKAQAAARREQRVA